jgi:hAT family C-terminal dimerisation region
MRAVLHDTPFSKQIWGLGGCDNSLVSTSAWANRIQVLSKLHLGSPRTGMHSVLALYSLGRLLFQISTNLLVLTAYTIGHGVNRLMCITTKMWWQKLCSEGVSPQLTDIAKRMLAMRPTSVESERNFSHAGLVRTAKRSRLRGDTTEMMMFIKLNCDLITDPDNCVMQSTQTRGVSV